MFFWGDGRWKLWTWRMRTHSRWEGTQQEKPCRKTQPESYVIWTRASIEKNKHWQKPSIRTLLTTECNLDSSRNVASVPRTILWWRINFFFFLGRGGGLVFVWLLLLFFCCCCFFGVCGFFLFVFFCVSTPFLYWQNHTLKYFCGWPQFRNMTRAKKTVLYADVNDLRQFMWRTSRCNSFYCP